MSESEDRLGIVEMAPELAVLPAVQQALQRWCSEHEGHISILPGDVMHLLKIEHACFPCVSPQALIPTYDLKFALDKARGRLEVSQVTRRPTCL